MSYRPLQYALLSAAFAASALHAADFSNYRDFTFGSNIAATLKQAGLNQNALHVVQTRPATIQEAEWQPRAANQGSAGKPESVREGVLSFYNGQLFRIVVTYDRYRIEGLTAEDLIDAVSRSYGTPTYPKVEIALRSSYGETATVLARWEDPGYAYDLVRTGDHASFALVLYAKALNQQAVASITEAARLDLIEAPQREIERQAKLDAEIMAASEKNRVANKPNFKP